VTALVPVNPPISPIPGPPGQEQTMEHICVCICTYKRPELLKRLLAGLRGQDTDGLFTCSVVVVDNDSKASAESTVLEFRRQSGMDIHYEVEPEQNISLARNRSVAKASGQYVALFDDDQYPEKDWLLTLYAAIRRFDADGALGPVKPYFETDPPSWFIKGKFHERETHETGKIITWQEGRTGNALLKRDLFIDEAVPFDPEFGCGAEDQDFFRRMILKGHKFVWCDEAVGYEFIPPIRWERSFLMRRALLRGKVALNHPDAGWKDVARSLAAIAVYLCALPFLLIMGHHHFMKYLVKLCDHIGLVLTAARLKVIGDKYIVE